MMFEKAVKMSDYLYVGDICCVCEHPVYTQAEWNDSGDESVEPVLEALGADWHCYDCYRFAEHLSDAFAGHEISTGATKDCENLFWTYRYTEGDPIQLLNWEGGAGGRDADHSPEYVAARNALEAWVANWPKNKALTQAESLV